MAVKNLGILIFDEVEVLDFCGPFEVFSITGNLVPNSVKVTTLAEKPQITARNGLKVVPDYIIGDSGIPQLDILLVPGGLGTITEVKNEKVVDWIKTVGSSAEFVLSVCTGVALLGKAGLLAKGSTATTHHLAFDRVRPDCPDVKFCKCRRFIDNGKVMTSAGISAGIDLSFHFVKERFGMEAAKKVAFHMEYEWKDVDCSDKNCTCNPA